MSDDDNVTDINNNQQNKQKQPKSPEEVLNQVKTEIKNSKIGAYKNKLKELVTKRSAAEEVLMGIDREIKIVMEEFKAAFDIK